MLLCLRLALLKDREEGKDAKGCEVPSRMGAGWQGFTASAIGLADVLETKSGKRNRRRAQGMGNQNEIKPKQQ